MPPKGRPDYPIEAARRAASLIKWMLTDANNYLVAPEGADRGRDFAALRMRIESVFSELEEVGNELLGGYDAAVPQRSLALLERQI